MLVLFWIFKFRVLEDQAQQERPGSLFHTVGVFKCKLGPSEVQMSSVSFPSLGLPEGEAWPPPRMGFLGS